jgi:hypothetical protein
MAHRLRNTGIENRYSRNSIDIYSKHAIFGIVLKLKYIIKVGYNELYGATKIYSF